MSVLLSKTDYKVCPAYQCLFVLVLRAMISYIRRIQMKNFKGFALGLVLGLGLAISGIGFAQNSTDQKKETESCCAMMPDCCKGDSCDMKMKHDAKNGAAKEGCCCCGDSCDMKMKHDMPEKPKA